MISSNELKSNLQQFSGTEYYYRHPLSALLYTDGVQYFAEEAGAYWIIDIVSSYWKQLKEGFYVIEITSEANKGLFTAKEDTDMPNVVSQSIEFTDLPEGTWKFFLIDGVLILPSEY